jgi:hypothetical protein
MKTLGFILILLLIITGCNREKPSVVQPRVKTAHSLATELNAICNISLLPEYIENSFCAQLSSWDTTGNNDDGFSGRYSFLRRNEDSSLVIFDVKGGGVINRIWTPTPGYDTLDFYIDNDFKPLLSISFIDLFSGRVFPFIQPLCGNQLGGYYCYLPIPFKKSCRIVTRGRKIQFHQIQYRLYNDKNEVVSFKPELSQEEKEILDRISLLFSKKNKRIPDFFQGNVQSNSVNFKIEPGGKYKVFETSKGGRILGIEISPAAAFDGLNKSIYLKITWDNETNPAVYCPVADFFGFAFGKASMQSLLLGSADNSTYCYFPMPFDKAAEIELLGSEDNSGSQLPVNIKVNVSYSTIRRDPLKEGKFYAFWHRNIRPDKGIPHTLAEIKGKGHYVGTILQAQGLKAGMTLFFEGDDSTSVDGSFRMHGTGSEDYFNGGWYAMMDRWDGRMSLPLHGSLDYSLPFCRTGGYRLFISDKISFEKSFFHSIEHGPVGNAFPVDYTSIGFYYSDTPPENIIVPGTGLSHVYIPDTLILYPQLTEFTLYGSIGIRTTWKYGTGGESYRFIPGGDSWVRYSLDGIPVGNYRMYFDIMMEPEGCEFSVWYRQTQLTDWISSFNSSELKNSDLYICDIDVDELKNSFTTKFRTSPDKTSFLLNRVILIKKD